MRIVFLLLCFTICFTIEASSNGTTKYVKYNLTLKKEMSLEKIYSRILKDGIKFNENSDYIIKTVSENKEIKTWKAIPANTSLAIYVKKSDVGLRKKQVNKNEINIAISLGLLENSSIGNLKTNYSDFELEYTKLLKDNYYLDSEIKFTYIYNQEHSKSKTPISSTINLPEFTLGFLRSFSDSNLLGINYKNINYYQATLAEDSNLSLEFERIHNLSLKLQTNLTNTFKTKIELGYALGSKHGPSSTISISYKVTDNKNRNIYLFSKANYLNLNNGNDSKSASIGIGVSL